MCDEVSTAIRKEGGRKEGREGRRKERRKEGRKEGGREGGKEGRKGGREEGRKEGRKGAWRRWAQWAGKLSPGIKRSSPEGAPELPAGADRHQCPEWRDLLYLLNKNSRETGQC